TKELSDIINRLKEAAEEQQKFSSLVDKSINLISMADLEGNIIYMNEGGLQLVGIDSKEDALKTHIKEFLFKDDLEKLFKKKFERSDYSVLYNGELKLRHFKTGEAIPVFFNAFRIEDPVTGKVLALALVCHDLRDQKKKEDEISSSREKLEAINTELNKKNEELLKTNIDLDNFVYTASHDLKSPISNLEGLLLAFDKPKLETFSDQEKQIIQMMYRSIFKLKDTINALVEITKAQRNMEESITLISFAEVLEEVQLEIKKSITESNAQIHKELNVEHVIFAKINLHSIIYNLLSNALKYRDPNKPLIIHIKTYKEDGKIVLEIQDNGLGIHKNQQGKLFGMFRRFHSHVEGTGIGLYIIKRMIENNKGQITVESDEGEGTTFKVFFKN
ncbi:MAG: PAS domain-containing sensor histidine kinase, partial [Bacteroidota bacterium]|nr:PAS domain-containing sensor histidine kinase [Bacteroidota bacterium]